MRWCVGGVGLSNPLKPFNQTIESIQSSHSVLQTNRNNPCKCFNRSIYHSSLSVQSMSPINHLNPFAPCSQLMHLPQPANTVCQSNHRFQFKLARTFQCNPFSHSTQSTQSNRMQSQRSSKSWRSSRCRSTSRSVVTLRRANSSPPIHQRSIR